MLFRNEARSYEHFPSQILEVVIRTFGSLNGFGILNAVATVLIDARFLRLPPIKWRASDLCENLDCIAVGMMLLLGTVVRRIDTHKTIQHIRYVFSTVSGARPRRRQGSIVSYKVGTVETPVCSCAATKHRERCRSVMRTR